MGKPNFVEINGKKYDAVTGAMVGNSQGNSKHYQSIKALDGFMTSRRKPNSAKSTSSVKSNSSHSNESRTLQKVSAAAVQRPKPQRTSTLVRKAVRKPAGVTKAASISTISSTAPASITSNNEKLANRVEPKRAARAQQIGKSNLIHKFSAGAIDFTSVIRKTVPMSVRPAPSSQHHSAAPAITQPGKPDPLNDALKRANSHEQTAPKKKPLHHRIGRKLGLSPRAVGVSAAVLAGIVLGGFFLYQNTPNVSMRIAAVKSGVGAHVPAYQPPGFAMSGPIKYSPGVVTISFKSNSDDRTFDVTQHTSNWNSDALLSNVVTASNKPYQTFEDKGRTIYIYDNSNATWVNGGVWYQIEGNSQLTSDQLVRIAASM